MSVVEKTLFVDRRWALQRLVRLLSCIRFDEVLVLQGTPALGALFAIGPLTTTVWPGLLALAIASCCLVAHVFLFNDWSGASTDLHDPNRAEQVFTARGVRSGAVGALCIALLIPGLVPLIPFGPTPLLLALVLVALSTLYSAPGTPMKGVPLASSALHLAGGLVHFLIGYSVFRALDMRGVAIGAYFALTFVAGHLTHEARDCVADASSGICTNAVHFGPARNFLAGFTLFTIADALLVVLAVSGFLPRLVLFAAATYPLHLWWTWQAWRAGLGFANIRRLQMRYRMLYAIIGIGMALATQLPG